MGWRAWGARRGAAEVHRIRGLGLCFVGDGKPPEASGCCVLESSRWQQRKVDVSLEEGDGSSSKKWEAKEQLGMQGTPAQAATKGRGSAERGRREDAEGPARRTNATWMTWWVGRFRLSLSPPHLPRRPQKQNPRQRFTR